MAKFKTDLDRKIAKGFEKSDQLTKQEALATRDNSDKNHNQTRKIVQSSTKESEKRMTKVFQKEMQEDRKAIRQLAHAVQTLSAQKDMSFRTSYVDVTPCKAIGGGGTNVVDDASAGTKTTAGLSDVTNVQVKDVDIKRLESEKKDATERLHAFQRPNKDPSSVVPTKQKVPAREEQHIASHHDRMVEGRRRKAKEDASKL